MHVIQLTKGLVATVDDADADLCALLWCAQCCSRTTYAKRSGARCGSGRRARDIFLHQLVAARMGIDVVNCIVDHHNGDGLDNRRANIRGATRRENNCNRRLNRNSTTGFKGVGYKTQLRRFFASIQVNGKRKHLGYFDDIIEAAIVYDRACYTLHGAFAHTNFPKFACGLAAVAVVAGESP